MYSRINCHKEVAAVQENSDYLQLNPAAGSVSKIPTGHKLPDLIKSRVGELCALFAHDINNPLQVLFTKIQIARMTAPGDDDLAMLEQETLRVIELVRGLGNLSRRATTSELRAFPMLFVFVDQQLKALLQRRKLTIRHSGSPGGEVLLHQDIGIYILLTIYLAACKYLPPDCELRLHSSCEEDAVVIRLDGDVATLFFLPPFVPENSDDDHALRAEFKTLREQIIAEKGNLTLDERSMTFSLPI